MTALAVYIDREVIVAHVKNHLLLGNIIAMLILAVAFTVRAGQAAPAGMPALAPLGSGFLYEGTLAIPNGTYDLRFGLYDAPTGGTLVGTPGAFIKENRPVAGGAYTVQLDFGAKAFPGDARWLQVSYRNGASTGAFTVVTPRVRLMPVPYALGLLPGATMTGNVAAPGRAILRATNTGSGVGLWASATSNSGVYGDSTTGRGVWGETATGDAGVYGKTGRTDGSGVYGAANAAGAAGVYGRNESGRGVWGYTPMGADGVFGQSDNGSGSGVHGLANGAGAAGVFGQSSAGTGVWGRSSGGVAMRAEGNAVQSRSKGGWVKASLFIGGDGALIQCYNGITLVASQPCSFTITNAGSGLYNINFGFQAFDRFVATSGAGKIYIVQWIDNNTLQIGVEVADPNYAYFITLY